MSDGPGRVVGVYEMFWDCAFCDTKALLGKTNRFCPNCGAPQDPAKRYFPPEGKFIAANTTYDGVDVACPACQTPNGAKANNCKHCGSPLNEAAKVALVGAAVPAKPVAPPVPPKKSVWPWVLGGVALLLVAGITVSLVWKKKVTVTVDGHAWSRVIDIEEKRVVGESSWCDSMPGDAYAVSRRREQRSTKQVADGQTCSMQKKDRGDGTFEQREVCTTKYRSEPVYDDKCSYNVDRWKVARSVRAGGALANAPAWPKFSLGRVGDSIGCEREGSHHETYTVTMSSPKEKQTYSCDYAESRWRGLVEGSQYPMKVRMVTGGADCDSIGQGD